MDNSWYEKTMSMVMSRSLAEDAGAPELRNPKHSAMRSKGLLERLTRWVRG